MRFWEPLAAYYSRKRFERLQYEQAARLLESIPQPTCDHEDDGRWNLVSSSTPDASAQQCTREKARYLVETNPFARNALTLYRNYVVGTGMQHEVLAASMQPVDDTRFEQTLAERIPTWIQTAGALWQSFLEVNHWATGSRRDWEFCQRTWRDGECFLRLFRQPAWPPRVHFVDPERIVPDPATGLSEEGIATDAHNVEVPLLYRIERTDQQAELVSAERMLHCKIGVDGNVKRGVSLLSPVLDALQKYQSWLDVELIHRKVASSIVLIRKHQGANPGGISHFADWSAAASSPTQPITAQQRRALLQPGTMIDAQGYDLQYLSPDSHFDVRRYSGGDCCWRWQRGPVCRSSC